LRGTLRVLSSEAPDLALDVVDTYTDNPSDRFGLLQAMVKDCIRQKGVDFARSCFSQKTTSEKLDGGYAAIASAVAAADPSEASGWLRRISNPGLRDAATAAVITQLTASSPEIASKFVADLIDLSPGAANEGLTLARLERTVQPWAKKDPPAAFSFVYSLNSLSSPGRKELLQRLAFY